MPNSKDLSSLGASSESRPQAGSVASPVASPVASSVPNFLDFSHTLIIGASVSAALTERNPSKLFLLDQGSLHQAKSHAISGSPGARVLSQMKKSILNGRTAVLAVDLMFWDAVMGLGEPKESRAYLKGFFNEIRARDLGIVIGNVPNFHGLQIHRDEINAAIEEECIKWPKTRILRLDRLFADCEKRGGIEYKGKLRTIRELLPDGLHPSAIAAEAICQEIFRALDMPCRESLKQERSAL